MPFLKPFRPNALLGLLLSASAVLAVNGAVGPTAHAGKGNLLGALKAKLTALKDWRNTYGLNALEKRGSFFVRWGKSGRPPTVHMPGGKLVGEWGPETPFKDVVDEVLREPYTARTKVSTTAEVLEVKSAHRLSYYLIYDTKSGRMARRLEPFPETEDYLLQ